MAQPATLFKKRLWHSYLWWNLNEHYYLTLTKSVICQIKGKCSPFLLLNVLPFRVRLERLIQFNIKLLHSTLYTLYLIFLSSHEFVALQSDSNYFGILLWIIIKTRGNNETKPPIGKYFANINQSGIMFQCPQNNCLCHL